MVFYINMEDFQCKARLVAGRHMTEAPKILIYASIALRVVSQEAIHIALTLTALNDLEVKVSRNQNTYLTAPVLK